MQAVVITAYKNLRQVSELCKLLETKFAVYVHVDKRAAKDEYAQFLSDVGGGGGYKVFLPFPCKLGRLQSSKGDIVSHARGSA